MNIKTRKLTFGAMVVAIFGVLLLLNETDLNPPAELGE